jgi:hypothetical protein
MAVFDVDKYVDFSSATSCCCNCYFIEVEKIKMTSTEIAEHLKKEAKELNSLADEMQSQAEETQSLAKHYYDAGNIEDEKECSTKSEECAVKAQELRKRAQDVINLAQKVRDKDEKAINDINQLHTLMDECTSNNFSNECAKACKFLVELIKQFILEKTEPYSTSFGKCGKLTQ